MAVILNIVESVMSRPWEWGRCDCCTAATEVFWALRGFDPMAELRGKYDKAGAKAMILEAGGLEALAKRVLEDAGLRRTGNPKPGDLGYYDRGHGALVVCAGDRWAGKTLRGWRLVRGVTTSWGV